MDDKLITETGPRPEDPSEAVTEEVEEPETLRVRYKGTADRRVLTRGDLSGVPGDESGDSLNWTPGSDIDWETVVEFAAGDEERARTVLRSQQHEFELVGPGSEEFWIVDDEEEFNIGGPEE